VTDLGTLGLQGNGFYEASPGAVFGRGGMVGDRADAQAQSIGRPVAPLRPETSDNIEAGLTWNSPRLRIDLAGFRIWLGNSIVSQTLLLPAGAVGQPLGDQIIIGQLPSGAVYVPVSPNPVLVRANYGGVRLDGVEHELRWRWNRAWAWRHNFTWIEARHRATGRPPDLEPGIPPPAFHAALLWSPPDRSWWVEPYLTIADEQRRLSSLALADRRIGATRSRANIATFFNNGAAARGWVANGRLLATGESLAEVQQRVLGPANSAPLFSRIPGYAVVGLRGGWTLRARHQFLVDLSNLTDRNWRGIGWGVDAPGFGVSLRYRVLF
jgi:hemoglobin/transferrin/lactoferrin receptor protein